MKNSNKKSRSLNSRRLHMESLETRELLSVTAAEFGELRSQYADLNLSANMNDYNVIEITASQLSDSNLRNAITTARSTTENDLIVVRTSATENTITLSGSQLSITSSAATYGSVTIVSLGDNPLTIDGNRQSQIFSITSNAIVGLAGLTITNGYSEDSDGGGIYNGATLTITKSTITENTVYGDMSSSGGGISNSGTLIVANSTISNNFAMSGEDGTCSGAGIENSFGTLTVINSTINNNIAYSTGGDLTSCLGGGISNWGTLTVTNSTITLNGADNFGGGIVNRYGTLTVTNSMITKNASKYGGGIDNDSTITVIDSTIAENTADSGAGIYNSSDGTIDVTNSVIAQNSASSSGGGVYNIGTFNATNSTITGNSAVSGLSAQFSGYGIYNNSGTTTLYNTIIAKNSSYDIYNLSGTISGFNNLSRFTNWANGSADNVTYNSAQPLFVNDTTGDYRLADNSQAIDNGNNSYASGITIDLAGNARVVGDKVDIGAYEYGSTPTTPSLSPTNFRAVTTAQTTISLDWNNVSGATGYILQRKNSSGVFETIYTGTESKFVDSQLTSDTPYEYRVTAIGDENYGYTTLTVKTAAKTNNGGEPIVDTPIFVTEPVYDNTENKVTLEWTNLGDEYTYVLYKAGRVVIDFGANSSYVDTQLSASGVEGYALLAYHKTTYQLSNVTMSVVHTTAKPLEITGNEASADGKFTLLWDAEPGITYSIFRAGRNISGDLTFSNDNIGRWTDNNPLANNDYMLVAVYQDGQTYRATFSNIYNLKKPLQSQVAAALNAFWADYDLDVNVDDEILNVIV
ncbi:MAG: hypothetical protein LBK82_08130 [Planctomycetaceae bacterium]|nr:hypothetical protein [Planctomycetaceae bacterium]